MQSNVSFGDTVYIQSPSNTILFTNGFFDDKIYGGASDNIVRSAFKSGHFVILPTLICNTEDHQLISKLFEQLQNLNATEKMAPVTKPKGRLIEVEDTPEPSLADLDAKKDDLEQELDGDLNQAEDEALLPSKDKTKKPEVVVKAGSLDSGFEYLYKEFQGKQALEDLKSERITELNHRILDEKLGKNVKYGQKVLLLNYESQQFLCSTENSNELDPSLVKLSVTKYLNQSCYFKFEVPKSSANLGELIGYETPLSILTNERNYVKFGNEVKVGIGLNPEIKKHYDQKLNQIPEDSLLGDKFFPQDTVRVDFYHNTFDRLFTVGISKLAVSEPFKLSSFVTYNERLELNRTKLVKNGDFVRIVSRQNFLTASKTPYEDRLFYESNQDINYPNVYIHSIFQAVKLDGENFNTSVLPIATTLSTRTRKEAFEPPSNKGFILKHSFTGLALGNPDGDAPLRPLGSGDQGENFTKVFLYGQIPEAEIPLQLGTNVFIRLTFDEQNTQPLFLDDGTDVPTLKEDPDTETSYYVGFREPADSIANFVGVSRKKPCMKEYLPTLAKITQVTDEESYMINFNINFAKMLKCFYLNLIQAINTGEFISPEDLAEFNSNCETYYKGIFLKKKGEKFLYNLQFFEKEIQTSIAVAKEHQVYARESRVIDLCNKILFYLLLKPDVRIYYDKEDQNFIRVTKEISKITQLSAKLLADIIVATTQNNDVNHHYNSQFVKIYINLMINPEGVLGRLPYQEVNFTKIKDLMLPVLLEFLHPDDLFSLRLVNKYSDGLFGFLENQGDFDVHVLQLLHHIFDTDTPSFEQTLRNQFMDEYLANPIRFKNFAPEIVVTERLIKIVFRRAGRQPIELPLNRLKEGLIQTVYLKWVLMILIAMSRRGSKSFTVRVATYYQQNLCEEVSSDSFIHYEIKSLMMKLVEVYHLSYKSLPTETIPSTIRILSREEGKYMEQLAAIIAKAKRNLAGEFEKDLLERERIYPEAGKKAATAGFNYLTFLDLTTFKFKEYLIAFSSISSIVNDVTQDRSETLIFLHNFIWRILRTTLLHDNETEVKATLKAAIPLLTKVEDLLLPHIANEATNKILESPQLQNYTKPFSVGGVLPDLAQTFTGIANQIVQEFISEAWISKREVYTLAQSNNKNLEAFPTDVSYPLIIEFFNKDLDIESQRILLRYLEFATQYKGRFLEMVASNPLIDDENDIKDFVRLVELLLETNRITRELSVMDYFRATEIGKAKIEGNIELLIEILTEILTIVYDYNTHTKGAYPHSGAPERKSVFLNFLIKEKEKDSPIPFLVKNEAVKRMWQTVMRLINADSILLSTAETLGASEVLSKILVGNVQARLASRLALMIMLVFVYENPENQNKLADSQTFMGLLIGKTPKQKEFFGVDLEILFVETLRGNRELTRMTKSHLKDVAINGFIKVIDLKFKFDPNADYNGMIAQTKSMNFILTSNFSKHIFRLDTRLIEELNELVVAISENDIFSLRALTNSPGSNITTEYKLPPFYYAFQEMLLAIEALVDGATPSSIAFLQSEYVRDTFMKLLMNQNLRIHFNMKRIVLNLFEKIFYRKFRKPGVFKDNKQAYAFLAIVLADLAGYVDIKNKSGSVNVPFLIEIRNRAWYAGSQEQKALHFYLTELDQDLEFPMLESLNFVNFLDLEYLTNQWINCIKSASIPLLITLLSEEREIFSDLEYDAISLIIDISTAVQGNNQTSKFVRDAICDLCNSIVTINEYAHWKERLNKVAYKNPATTNVKAEVVRVVEQVVKTSLSAVLKAEARVALKNSESFEMEQIRLLLDTSKNAKVLATQIISFITTDIIDYPQLSNQSIYCVKLLIELIKSQNSDPKEKVQPIYKWHELKEADWKALEELQTYLSENGLPELILLMLNANHHSHVATSLFDLTVCLLYGGNEEVQDKFYFLVSQDPENQFLSNLHRLFVKKLYYMKNVENERIKKLYTESQKIIFFRMQSKKTVLSPAEIESQKLEMEQSYLDSLPAADKISVEHYAQDLLLLMKLLQSLCEGHHENFQEFLREQKFEGKKLVYSINFLDVFKRAYHDFVDYMSIFSIQFGVRLIDVIIETIQGLNRANAYVFLENTLINDLTNTLRIYDGDYDSVTRGFVNEDSLEHFIELKDKAICLLRDMIEGSDPEKINQIRDHFNVLYAVRTLYNFLRTFFTKKGLVFTTNLVQNTTKIRDILKRVTLEENKGILRSSLVIYSILKHLWGNEKDFEEFVALRAQESGLNEYEMKEFRLYVNTFCEEYCLSVEILTKRNPGLIRIYFPKLTICSIIDGDDTLDNFNENVDRSNTLSKVEGLVNETKKLIPAMYSEYKNRMGQSFNAIRTYNISVIISEILAIVINVYILAIVTYDDNTETVKEGNLTQRAILYSMIGIQAFNALVQIVCFVRSQSGTRAASKWTDRVEEKKEELGPELMREIDTTFSSSHIDFTLIDNKFCDAVLDLKGPFSEEYELLAANNEYIRKRKERHDIKFVISDPMFIWQLIFFVICCLSEYRAFWCAFQTLNWVVRSDSVKRVAMAISENTKQFLWTLLLLLIAIFIYMMIGFYFFNDQFVDSNTGAELCGDTFTCFFWTLNLGLRNGGGIGDAIGERTYDENDRWSYVASVLYNLSFFVIVIILLMNVIFGMIIDAFGQLRDKKNENEEDMMNVCFICGIERGEYERKAAFDVHVNKEHCVKNYIYYLTYILEKEKTESVDLTDVESFVLEHVHKGDNRWFPIGRSITFETMSN